jgi:hypothetical protein
MATSTWGAPTTSTPLRIPTFTEARTFIQERADTPRIFLAAMYAIWILAGLLLLVAISSVGNARAAVTTIGLNTAPSIISAQKMRASLLRMDASTAQELLYGRDGSPAAQAMFEQHRQIVGTDLIAASKNITFEGEQPVLESLQINLGMYEQYAAEVRLHNRNGDLPRAVASMQAATRLMQEKIIPAADQLDAINLREFEAAYAKQRTASMVERGLILVVGTLLAIVLLATQVYFNLRTPRRLSLPLIAGTLAVLVVVGYMVTLMGNSERELRLARDDAFMSIHALLQARADAYDANSDESLYLVPGFDKAAYDASFQTKIALLVDRPISDQLTSAVPSSNANFKGRLGDAWRNVTFPGEKEAISDALRGWAWFVIADLQIRAAERVGRHEAAVQWATGPALGDTPASFKRFEDAMDKVIAVNQGEFDGAISRSLADLQYGEVAVVIAMLLVAAMTWFALWPRIGEYRG